MYNIAIDGPSGSGKSSVAKELAKILNFIYVDTGAMYRSLALYFIENNIDISREDNIISHLNNIDIKMEYKEKKQLIFLNSIDISNKIRNEKVAAVASKISTFLSVREKLLNLQREIAKNNDTIMDGRDIGSFVLPNANLKIYLTASVEKRADRRFKELEKQDKNISFSEIKKDIEERDYRDMNRKIAPLIKVDDAILIDSSNLSINEVVEKIIKLKGENERNKKS